MDRNAQVFRTEATLKQALADIAGAAGALPAGHRAGQGQGASTPTCSRPWSSGFLLDLAEVIVVGRAGRARSRAAATSARTTRTRDDVNFMRHTMAYRRSRPAPPAAGRRVRLDYKPGDRDPLPADGAQVLMTTRDHPVEATPRRSPSRSTARGGGGRRAREGRPPGEVPSFDVTLRIRRYDPEDTDEHHWQEFTVTAHGTDRLLDALHKIKWEKDGSLTFRRSCAHGVCGSDAMRINGRNRLACKVLLKDLEPRQADHRRAHQGPAGGEGPRRRHGAVLPVLPRGHAVPHHERARADPRAGAVAGRPRSASTTRPSASSAPRARRPARCSGPTASTSARPPSSTRTGSSSTAGTRAPTLRLEILNDREGVWRCRTTFNCSEACPRGIEVTKAIQEVKQALLTRKV